MWYFSYTENDGESPRDVMLDLSASQKSSGFEFDENEDKIQNKVDEVNLT